ncbi:hypothetical protein GCM10023228_33590 [Brevibacillus fulvus]|uniref:Uncharacterized protein n=1 Tax=Brevibacillus fulvus TaxID=1125967 RepID=A0A939BQM1_9BACL|nr:hypothetical protein [Brevibacillus fulvus]
MTGLDVLCVLFGLYCWDRILQHRLKEWTGQHTTLRNRGRKRFVIRSFKVRGK